DTRKRIHGNQGRAHRRGGHFGRRDQSGRRAHHRRLLRSRHHRHEEGQGVVAGVRFVQPDEARRPHRPQPADRCGGEDPGLDGQEVHAELDPQDQDQPEEEEVTMVVKKATTTRKTAAKKAPAKKTAAKKTTAKKAPAKKTAARKTTAKKAPA